MENWSIEPIKIKRKKTSVYLREDITEGLKRLQQRKKMSFSETVNRVIEQGLGIKLI